jgi:hypothetical protein
MLVSVASPLSQDLKCVSEMVFSQASPTNPAIFTTKVRGAGAERLCSARFDKKTICREALLGAAAAAETSSLLPAQNGAPVAAPIASYCGAKLTTRGNWV